MAGYYNFQPLRVLPGIRHDVCLQIFQANIFKIRNFRLINQGKAIRMPREHIVDFVFNQLSAGHVVLESENVIKSGANSHFLFEAVVGCFLNIMQIGRKRMAAASVGPKPGRMVFFFSSFLQQKLSFVVENEY